MNKLSIKKPYARIYEIGKVSEIGKQDNELWIYKDSPETIALQIRTCKSITGSPKGTQRNMLAHVSLNENEALAFIQYAKQSFGLD